MYALVLFVFSMLTLIVECYCAVNEMNKDKQPPFPFEI